MEESFTENNLFIPVVPIKQVRLGVAISNALPGFILILSVLDRRPATIGELLLNVFCLVSGIAVIFFSIRSYRISKELKGADMLTVLTGLLLIAQGALMFDAMKGFQPAHLYFVAAALFIFRGYMFPKSAIQRGFLVSNETITARVRPFKKTIIIDRKKLREIHLTGDMLNFVFLDETTRGINVKRVENKNEILDSLKQELLKNHGTEKEKINLPDIL